VRESLKENRRDKIHARIASRRATLICFGEKTLSRGYRPIQSFREDTRRKEEKMENKSDFIYHHGTWGKKEKSFFFDMFSLEGALLL
jgi:hypothetical protein